MQINLKKILCPTDFSENSEHAMKYALTLAAMSKAELISFSTSLNPSLIPSPPSFLNRWWTRFR